MKLLDRAIEEPAKKSSYPQNFILAQYFEVYRRVISIQS